MPLEIERKFLVTGDAWRQQIERSVEMRQGYLAGAGGRASVRVRLEGEVAKLNIKAAVVGSARAEYESEMQPDECREILPPLCGGSVEKTPRYVPARGAHGGAGWGYEVLGGDHDGWVDAEEEVLRIG